MEEVRVAEMIATLAHIDQVDKGGNPYIEHPRAVSCLVTTDLEKTVAWLHDVVEDTFVTLEDLKRVGFSDVVVMAVDAITRRYNESREDYLERVVRNPIAVMVKLADLTNNADLTRIENPTDKDRERTQKYIKEIEWINNKMGEVI